MKTFKISFILLCICLHHFYAQDNALYNGIQRAKNSGVKFEPVSVITLAGKSASQSKKIEDHFFNPQEVYLMHYSRTETKKLNASITLIIPLGSRDMQLELQEHIMDYRVTTSDGKKIPPNKNNRHYHGIVKDDPGSIVAITFGGNEISGLIDIGEGNLSEFLFVKQIL